jgi:site-specific DNA-adenine methylase
MVKMAKVTYGLFPYAGGKALIANKLWERFGPVDRYVEPFAGSLAVLLNCPYKLSCVTVNDSDCYVSNFWRAMTIAPEEVYQYASTMPSEIDIHAWSLYFHENRAEVKKNMLDNPVWYDAEYAGRWAMGMCWSFVNNFAITKSPNSTRPSFNIPTYGNKKTFVCDETLYRERFDMIKKQLRSVRVAYGDWTRVVKDSILRVEGAKTVTGVFLDPPYELTEREYGTHYADTRPVMPEVIEWCKKNSHIPNLKIALCGYDLPDIKGWERVKWTANGGFGNFGNDNNNRKRETILFSPSCGGAALIDNAGDNFPLAPQEDILSMA